MGQWMSLGDVARWWWCTKRFELNQQWQFLWGGAVGFAACSQEKGQPKISRGSPVLSHWDLNQTEDWSYHWRVDLPYWDTFWEGGGVKKISIKDQRKGYDTDGPDAWKVSSHGHLLDNIPPEASCFCFSRLSRSPKEKPTEIRIHFLGVGSSNPLRGYSRQAQPRLGGKEGVVGGSNSASLMTPPHSCHIPPLLFVFSTVSDDLILPQLLFQDFHVCCHTWRHLTWCVWLMCGSSIYLLLFLKKKKKNLCDKLYLWLILSINFYIFFIKLMFGIIWQKCDCLFFRGVHLDHRVCPAHQALLAPLGQTE